MSLQVYRVGSAVAQLVERARVSSPVKSLCCLLEQDALPAAKHWFNPVIVIAPWLLLGVMCWSAARLISVENVDIAPMNPYQPLPFHFLHYANIPDQNLYLCWLKYLMRQQKKKKII